MITYDKKVANQSYMTTADDGMLKRSMFAKVKAAYDMTCTLWDSVPRAQGQLEGVKMRNEIGIKRAFPLL